jgi:hypothetical protein
MHPETNLAEVLFAESQRLGAFVEFWQRRYVPPKVVI